jgi:triosephosphate isomerase (TIM)
MRTPIIAGNWKMHKTRAEAAQLAAGVRELAGEVRGVDVVLCPPFTALGEVAEAVAGSRIAVGAQDLFWRESGAYTGEISAPMLRDAGCEYVIIGHSERRGRFGVPEKDVPSEALTVFGDSEAAVGLKMRAALAHGLMPIVCCGETLSERKLGWTDEVVAAQLARGLADMDPAAAARMVIAYEPVWAIGTGEVCAAAEANRVCGLMRRFLRRFMDRAADEIRILYGGSVKPENAVELLAHEEIDGALVGGASLEAASFHAIIAAATPDR